MKKIANAKPAPSPTAIDGDGLGMFREIAESLSLVPASKSVTKTKKKAVTKRQRQSIDQRCRKRFSFWLEMDKVGQVDLWEWFTELKLRREFAPVIRIAVTLYRELLNGRFDMLYQVFPETKPQPLPPSVSPEKIKEMEDELATLRKKHDVLEGQVEILQQVIISQRLPAAIDNAVNAASVGQGAPVRTPRPSIAPKPAYVEPSPVVEADTSSSFLDMF